MRQFTEREIVPYLAGSGNATARLPRELHRKAARSGTARHRFPGTAGAGDLLDSVVLTEEIIQAGGSSGVVAALFTHGIAIPHIIDTGNAEYLIDTVRQAHDRR